MTRALVPLLALMLACDPGTAGPTRPGDDGGVGTDAGGPPGGCRGDDSDGDGIDDGWETSDAEDTDGDGYTDAEEAGTGGNPCVPADSDSDGIPDFLDPDSDNDGLPDSRERELGTDRTRTDSDGDGLTDLAEVDGTGTDPLDETEALPEGDFFVVLRYLENMEDRLLQFGSNINQADVFFLVDMTGSMQQERTNLIQGLLDVIIPGIEASIRDVWFGAGGMDDYPYGGHGSTRDLPFYLLKEVGPAMEDRGAWSLPSGPTTCPSGGTNDIGVIQGAPNGTADILEAVQGLPCHSGADVAESYIPALYATATGMGLTWPGGSIPSKECAVIPDFPGDRTGYPCFRPGSLPIIILFGDANHHNDYMGNDGYSGAGSPSYADTMTALNGIGARVVSVWSQLSGRDDYEAVGRDTGTVDGAGDPLVFDINTDGSGLSDAVVNGVASLVGGTPQDVSTRTENEEGRNPDNFDATLFIKAITPVEGYRDGIRGTGYDSFDDTTFYNVIPGTIVEFNVDFYNDVRPPASVAQIFVGRIYVVGNGVADLEFRYFYVVVPPEGGVVII